MHWMVAIKYSTQWVERVVNVNLKFRFSMNVNCGAVSAIERRWKEDKEEKHTHSNSSSLLYSQVVIRASDLSKRRE